MEIKVSIEGTEKADRVFDIPGLSAKIAEDLANTLRNMAIGRSPVKTGKFKGSWGPVQPVSGGFSFENATSYGIILEEGLYPGVGPRTVEFQGRIYSRQVVDYSLGVAGVLRPLLEDPTLPDRIARMMEEEIGKRAP